MIKAKTDKALKAQALTIAALSDALTSSGRDGNSIRIDFEKDIADSEKTEKEIDKTTRDPSREFIGMLAMAAGTTERLKTFATNIVSKIPETVRTYSEIMDYFESLDKYSITDDGVEDLVSVIVDCIPSEI